jgi:hypothetical protein
VGVALAVEQRAGVGVGLLARQKHLAPRRKGFYVEPCLFSSSTIFLIARKKRMHL